MIELMDLAAALLEVMRPALPLWMKWVNDIKKLERKNDTALNPLSYPDHPNSCPQSMERSLNSQSWTGLLSSELPTKQCVISACSPFHFCAVLKAFPLLGSSPLPSL
jgi:hypothetical protein